MSWAKLPSVAVQDNILVCIAKDARCKSACLVLEDASVLGVSRSNAHHVLMDMPHHSWVWTLAIAVFQFTSGHLVIELTARVSTWWQQQQVPCRSKSRCSAAPDNGQHDAVVDVPSSRAFHVREESLALAGVWLSVRCVHVASGPAT